ncbi:MAG: IniB N-terminal domain-containing protein, partial [Gammaproteobacteria bacterium]
MLSVSSLIEFLMNLLRDEAAAAEFDHDPHAMLARHGLDGLSGQDVRDAAPMVADHQGVRVKDDDSLTPTPDDDPIGEISHLKAHYELDPTSQVDDSDEYHLTYVDDRDTLITVDDRDTTTITADGDVTITDSFNQDNDVTVIEDSFNQDNDGVDNKDGTINDSALAGEDIDDSLNSDDDTTATDSHNTNTNTNTNTNNTNNTNNSDTTDDGSDDDTTDSTDTTATTATDSYNHDDDTADLDAAEETPADADT